MALSKHRVLVRGKTPHPHEAEAIDFIVGALPDNEPYSLWALVDLIDPSGRLYEIDALILGYNALYLVEVKSHPGEVRGNVVDWEYHFPDGGVSFRENPLRLVNQKARVLAGLLDRKMGRQRPWVEPLVLLSHPDVKVALDAQGRLKVVTCATFARAITHGDFIGASPELTRFRLDQPTAKETRKVLREIGLVPSKGALKVGEFALGDILEEGPGYQDREAHHEQLREMHRRVRLYVIPSSTTPERRDQLRRAAEREARVLTVLGDHRNILGCKDYLRDGPTGAPCLVFDQFEDALPLDAFLRQHPDLSFDDRITILRQIGEALEYCHRKDVVHRGLSPSAVLVRRQAASGTAANGTAASSRIEVRLYNFQLATREGSIGTDHLSVLAPNRAELYRAPEVIEDPDKASPASDVFSLGAIAYLVLTGRPPGADVTERHRLLEAGRLSVAAANDALAGGTGGTDEAQRKSLDDVVGMATEVNPLQRADSAIAWVNLLLDAVTAPQPKPEEKVDPLYAHSGDRLEQDLEVVKVLGSGSTARVLHVVQGSTNYALKVPLSPDLEPRLLEEARVLDKVRSDRIVAKAGWFRAGGRQCLLVTYAGETLAEVLARQGPVSLDYAQRWGNDLIQSLGVLEEHGVQHRDIKPANLGVSTGPGKKALHLILFDFSLATTDPRAITTGTPAYRDPFLVKRGRWDEAADHYSAAVTLYEMLTGARPRYGTGDAAAVATDEEATIDAERFDPSVRSRLVAFFRKALARDVTARHANAEAMHADWLACFATGVAVTGETEERPRVTSDALAVIPPDSSIESLPLSVRARNALDRSGVVTVRDLLQIPMNELSGIRRVGRDTAREILEVVRAYRDAHKDAMPGEEHAPFWPDYRGPDALVSSISNLAAEASGALEDAGLGRVTRLIAAPKERVERILERFPGAIEAIDAFLAAPAKVGVPATIEDWLDGLVPTPRQRGDTYLKHVRLLLGLDALAGGIVIEAAALARTLGVTPAAIYISLGKARESWREHPHLTVLHEAVCAALESVGGVATVSKVAEVLPSFLPHAAGCGETAADHRAAAAVVRIVGETGRNTNLTRLRGELWLGLTSEHQDAARRLGVRADEIAGREPLPSSEEVREALAAVARDTPLAALSAERLVSLAAEASARAARSARLELYPREMPAARSIKLCAGAFASRQVTPEQVAQVVRSRYPDAAAIPERPELDDLLADVGFQWREERGAYCRRGLEIESRTVTPIERRPTTHTPHRPTAGPELEEAAEFEERLRIAVERRDFRVLAVNAAYAEEAAEGLARRLSVTPCSLETELIAAASKLMQEENVESSAVYEADRGGSDHPDWHLLRDLMRQSAGAVADRFTSEPGPLLLTHPGLLARYQLDEFLQKLIDTAARDNGLAVLLLVPEFEQSGPTAIHGTLRNLAIPMVSPAQQLRVPLSWIENAHRGKAA